MRPLPSLTGWSIALGCAVVAGPAVAGHDPGPDGGEPRPPPGPPRGAIVRVDHPPPEQVTVEAGWFVMGVPPADVPVLAQEECPQVTTLVQVTGPTTVESICNEYETVLYRRSPRTVWLDGFRIDRTEVTQRAYRACVAAGGCSPAPLVDVPGTYRGDDLPVVWIDRAEAQAYCAWRGGRLPTEAEWEKAARGVDSRTWPWGDGGRRDEFNHGRARDAVLRQADTVYKRWVLALGDPDDVDGHRYAAPVGSYRWGRGPYGAVDQAGNVAEWVADDWSPDGYDGLPAVNPVRRVEGSAPAVSRGGSWRDPPFLGRVDVPTYASVVQPPLLVPQTRAVHLGFRCVTGGAVPDPDSGEP